MRSLLALLLLASVAHAQRAPDGSILPSERTPAESLGCGRAHQCFYAVPLSAPERQTLIHALWANDERRDDYQRGVRARIFRMLHSDATPSFSLPEIILAGVALSNAQYPNRAQDEASEEERAAARYLRDGGTLDVKILFQKFQVIMKNGG